MRLIDADALELDMQDQWEQNEISNGEWIDFRETLKRQPTIDAVEVVKCKDCKWYDKDGLCDRLGIVIFQDEVEVMYCSHGERRTE